MVLGKFKILGANEDGEDAEPAPGPRIDGTPGTFSELLEYCRATWGEKVAFQQKLRRDWQRFSFEDVHQRSYEIAAGLVASGLQRGDRVLLIQENGYDWVCSYYGIVLAGGIAVPIYYELKASEIHDMAAHADPAIAIVAARTLSRIEAELPALKSLVIVGDEVASKDAVPGGFRRKPTPERLSLQELQGRATSEARREVAARDPQPDDTASIMFTSGTSGGSKGVMLSHRNFLANCRQVRASIPFNDRDRLVIVLPLHHAFPFVVTMVIAPTIGGEVTFENDLRRIRDRMGEVKPTIFLGVPALFEVMYRNIVKSIEAQGRLETFEKGLRIVEATKQRTGVNLGRIVFRELHKRMGGRLRFLVSGGAALNPQVARNFASLGVPIIQGWGLSEASPILAAQRWNPRKFYMSNYYEDHFGSIGQPLEGVEIGLIDVPEKELYVHLHGDGEFIARGENITQGYWRAPEETAAIKVGEWLRTGDIGRIDEEGNLWITGRSKFVIVLDSGEKIHPDEVEEKIERGPAIEDVVVLGRKQRGKVGVLAVVYPNRDVVLERLGAREATSAAVHEIITEEIALQQQDVAAYKRVSEVMLTDEPLPRTPIRKVMRGQIRDSYTFDIGRWGQTWNDVLAASSEPAATPDTDDDAPPLTA